MADAKISALTAVATPAGTDEFAVNQGGTSKRMTLTQVRDFSARTLIAGNSGAANATAAPSETWQVLTSNASANSTTTAATVMTTTSLPVGTYSFRYVVRYQVGVTTTGVKFLVDYTGTVTSILARHLFAQELSTAASLVADSAQTPGAVGLLSSAEVRADATLAGPTLSADTANADMMWTVEGLLIVSTSANLLLQHGSEVAASTQVMAGTHLLLQRLA